MEYIYAALLLHHAKAEVSEERLKKVLTSAGVKVDEVRVKALVAALKEVNVDEAIKAAAIPISIAPTMPSSVPSSPTPSEAAPAEKKEEKKEEVSEEALAEGLSALFG